MEKKEERGENTVWEMTPSSGHPVPIFTSLRGQLHHLRREEEPKVRTEYRNVRDS